MNPELSVALARIPGALTAYLTLQYFRQHPEKIGGDERRLLIEAEHHLSDILVQLGLAKAQQLGLFRDQVKAPGSRGGKFYRTESGEIRYGEKPPADSVPALSRDEEEFAEVQKRIQAIFDQANREWENPDRMFNPNAKDQPAPWSVAASHPDFDRLKERERQLFRRIQHAKSRAEKAEKQARRAAASEQQRLTPRQSQPRRDRVTRDAARARMENALRHAHETDDFAARRLAVLSHPHVQTVWRKAQLALRPRNYPYMLTHTASGGWVLEQEWPQPEMRAASRREYDAEHAGNAWHATWRNAAGTGLAETLHNVVYAGQKAFEDDLFTLGHRHGLHYVESLDLPEGFKIGDKLVRPSGETVEVVGAEDGQLLVRPEGTRARPTRLTPTAVTSGRVLRKSQMALFGDGSIKNAPQNFLGSDRLGRPHWRATEPIKPTLPPPPTPNEEYKRLGTSSPAFRRWFADSKVVDAKGDPKETYEMPRVVYHGSSAGGFATFDPAKLNEASLYGPGFYFTESRELAESYTNKPPTGETRISDAALKELAKFIRKRLPEGATLRRSSYIMHGLGIAPSSVQSHYTVEMPDGSITGLLSTMPADKIAFLTHVPEVLGWNQSTLEQWRLATKQLGWNPPERKPEVKACYLAIRNSFDVTKQSTVDWLRENAAALLLDTEKPWLDWSKDHRENSVHWLKQGPHPKDTPEEFIRRALGDSRRVGDLAVRLGFDGITHMGGAFTHHREHRVWIAFKPEQIKAVENEGTFDPQNADIYKAQPAREVLSRRESVFKDLWYLENEDRPAAAGFFSKAWLGRRERNLRAELAQLDEQIRRCAP